VVSSDPLIESDSSNEACLTARDVAAPAAPGGLTILAQEGGLELRWSPSPESDLAFYRVYRAVSSGSPEKLAELPAPTTSYLDKTAAPGTAYRYTVTAVDRAGNESPPSSPLLGNLP
jgi:fibronectin type 3 domain-containing protein